MGRFLTWQPGQAEMVKTSLLTFAKNFSGDVVDDDDVMFCLLLIFVLLPPFIFPSHQNLIFLLEKRLKRRKLDANDGGFCILTAALDAIFLTLIWSAHAISWTLSYLPHSWSRSTNWSPVKAISLRQGKHQCMADPWSSSVVGGESWDAIMHGMLTSFRIENKQRTAAYYLGRHMHSSQRDCCTNIERETL